MTVHQSRGKTAHTGSPISRNVYLVQIMERKGGTRKLPVIRRPAQLSASVNMYDITKNYEMR